ncbi:MAG: response regulator [Proteobacteria bacterium]|nr:response regulator [Pseudomonadota bacterium]
MTDGDGLRVLIVEDEAILALEIELVLRELGHTVVGSAMDAARALTLAAEHAVDLALIDMNLRDGPSGPEIARRLVGERRVNVIFLTANPELIPDGFAGALGALPKPFDERGIQGIVEFARRFIRMGEVAAPPRRFRLAPWLLTPPEEIKPH